MARYIKEDEMREVIDKWQETLEPRFDLKDSVIFDTLESVNFHIDYLATADVVEVVHAFWEEVRTDYICSHCNTSFSDELLYIKYPYDLPKYCPEGGVND